MAKKRNRKRHRTRSLSKESNKRKKRKLAARKRCQGITAKSTRCKRKVNENLSYCYQHLPKNNAVPFEYLIPLTLNEQALSNSDLDRMIQFREEYRVERSLYEWENGFMLRSPFVYRNNKKLDENGVPVGHTKLLDAIKDNNWLGLDLIYEPIYPILSNQYFARQYYRNIFFWLYMFSMF
eukprot:446998_1